MEQLVIQTKSAYEPRRAEDGYRVFIEPIWPRDLPKGKALGADWMKNLYPSPNLRDWVRRNPRKVDGFRERYLLELARHESAIEKLQKMHAERGTLTILTVPGGPQVGIHETLVQYLEAV
jgi:uncharacterized protein YeaO (DUF488 family)